MTTVKRVTNDSGTDLTLTVEVVEQNVEDNTTTLRRGIDGRVVLLIKGEEENE